LLAEGLVELHRPSRAEVAAHLRAAERALQDAALPGISAEGRFQLAYAAALDLATVAVVASGHRILSRVGHHALTFEAAGIALGSEYKKQLSYLDRCRRRRNIISCDGDEVSGPQADELLMKARWFSARVMAWLHKRHARLE
jgi:hypothetical protein